MATGTAKPRPDEAELQHDPTESDREAEAAVENARSLAVRDSMIPRLHTGEPAYKQFSQDMLALVAKTIMPPKYTVAELYMGLEIAATYGLDPFTKELWLIRMKENGPVVPLVGRDGLLAIAERHKDYQGFRNAEVYEKDTFEYDADPRQLPDGSFSHVRHSFTMVGDRGALLGAYAEVYRHGKPPVFFFAKLSEYDRGGNTPWSKQKTAMIRKCALANALRLAFRISGLYVGDESSGISLEMAGQREQTASGEVVPLHTDPKWAGQFEALFRARNDITPGTYLPAKQKVLLASCEDEEALTALAQKLSDEIEDAGGVVPTFENEADDDTPIEGEVELPDEETSEATSEELALDGAIYEPGDEEQVELPIED